MSQNFSDQPDDPFDLVEGEPFQGTFDVPASEQYGGARGGIPVGEPVEYEYKKGISFLAPPMQDLGPLFSKETYTKRKLVKDGGIHRKTILESAVRASRVISSSQEPLTPKSSPRNGRLQFVMNSEMTLDQNVLETTPVPSSSNLLGCVATEKKKEVLPPAEKARPSLHISDDTFSGDSATTQDDTCKQTLDPGEKMTETPPHQLTKYLFLGKFKGAIPPKHSSNDANSSGMPKLGQSLDPTAESEPTALTTTKPSSALLPTSKGLLLPPLDHQLKTCTPRSSLHSAQRPLTPANPSLCFCKQPARGPEDRIVKCTNPDCTIVNYHYRCLDKSQKLSTRGRHWVCVLCRSISEYAKQAADQPDEKLKTSVWSPFELQDIKAALASPRVKMVEHPYGFGADMCNGYEAGAKRYGVLGVEEMNGQTGVVYGVCPDTEFRRDNESDGNEEMDKDGPERSLV